ncbi:WD repeat-containing protein 92-like protein [Paraphysoderma sedebokerense]|nr:WD repeat-containing protein 92-like protein [Paraphysoderma sedebokerense]
MTQSLSKPQIITHITKSLAYTPYDAKWIPSSAKFVVLGQYPKGSGTIQIFELDASGINVVAETEKPSAFKCGTFGASPLHQRNFATGDFDGKLALWDIENMALPIFSIKAHESIINCIDGCGSSLNTGPPEIVTGGRDGAVKVWDTRQRDKPVANIAPEKGEEVRDCWAVAFGNSYNDSERCVCAGYDNGDVKLFDLRKMELTWETNVKNGICGLEFDRKDIKMNKLAIATLESQFHVYDMRTQHPEKGFASVTEKPSGATTIWTVRHTPQNRDVFVTSSGNGALNLYKYRYPSKRQDVDSKQIPYGIAGNVELLASATIADQPISSFDWSPDKLGLCVFTGFDQAVRVGIVTKLAGL